MVGGRKWHLAFLFLLKHERFRLAYVCHDVAEPVRQIFSRDKRLVNLLVREAFFCLCFFRLGRLRYFIVKFFIRPEVRKWLLLNGLFGTLSGIEDEIVAAAFLRRRILSL